MRTIVDLPEEQVEELSAIAKQARLPRAELLRRAVSEYLLRHKPDHGDAAFGLWKENRQDGLDYEDRMRSEWGK